MYLIYNGNNTKLPIVYNKINTCLRSMRAGGKIMWLWPNPVKKAKHELELRETCWPKLKWQDTHLTID